MAVVVILNETSSSGKSSLARALQEVADRPFLHVQMDAFLAMQPPRLDNHPDGFLFHQVPGKSPPEVAITTGPAGKRLMSGMRAAVSALADAGNDLIVDDVWLGAGEQDDYVRLLAGHKTLFVGVHAQLDVLEQRERARGDRDIGQASWQLPRVHTDARYDVEIDTGTAPPSGLARFLAERLGL